MLSGDTALARGQQGPFHNTLSGLAEHWSRIDVITSPVKGGKPFAVFENTYIHPVHASRILQASAIARKAVALIDEYSHDVIASHDYGLFHNGRAAATVSQQTGIPYVSEIHHVDGYPQAGSAREKIQLWLARKYVQWAQHRAAGFRITNTSELRPLLRSWGIPDSRLHLLYSLYLDFDIFSPVPTEKKYDAIFVGRLSPNKNPEMFLEGVAQVRHTKKDIKALIVGRGKLRGQLKQRLSKLDLSDNVEFRDWIASPSELAELYRQSRCLVCTSHSEGGPRVVAEAMACGVPVISTRVGLAAELIEHGKNGFLIDWSAQDLATRLTELLDAPTLGATAPAAVQRFEKSALLREYAQAYKFLAVKRNAEGGSK